MSALTTTLHKAEKRLTLLRDLQREFPLKRVRALRRSDADLVVWIHHSYPAGWLKYFFREDGIVKDAGLLAGLARAGLPFQLVTGNKIDRVRNKRVIYSIFPYNPNRRKNYSDGLVEALREIESHGNTLAPRADEAEWWENKIYMHRRFAELGVNCPPTTIDRLTDDLDTSLTYPLLVKEPHSSGSLGLHKVDSAAEHQRVRDELRAAGETEVLTQGLIDMKRDLRVTIVGDQVVHHYFRINTTDAWQPTSTKRGSIVDFETFPERWRAHILEVFSRFGLRTGAFDICWEGDDLATEPIFLEVSPAYTPNPPLPPAFADRPYADFKLHLRGPDAYGTAFVRNVFRIQEMILEEWGITSE